MPSSVREFVVEIASMHAKERKRKRRGGKSK